MVAGRVQNNEANKDVPSSPHYLILYGRVPNAIASFQCYLFSDSDLLTGEE